jgi:glycine cleavage system H protein
MPTVMGCYLPDDLWYDIDNHVWYRPLADGSVEVGPTQVGVAMAKLIVAVTPKRSDRRLESGQAAAVVESGKIVAAAKVSIAGFVVASNEELMERPALIVDDPYGRGWFVRLRPDDWEAAQTRLIPGDRVAGPYAERMRQEAFKGCGQE